ncbi:MAG: hypothetical protein ACD_72C00535G0007 [uncultured bacterium]|nr:MAG: hypothetical protein ACD_72C00535G0007 [uncultured bacterium]
MIKRLLSDSFVKNNIFYLTGSILIGAFNYLFYPVLGRLLTSTEFGEVQTLVTILSLATLFITIFGSATINIVANSTDDSERNSIISQFRKLITGIALILAISLAILSPWLKNFFHFTSIYTFILLAALIPLNIPNILRTSFLQGKKQFYTTSINGVTLALGKLLASAAFVLIGLRVGGVLLGILFAQVVSLIYLYKKTNHDLILSSFKTTKLTKRLLTETAYGTLILAVAFVTTFFTTADVLFAKRFFSPEEAGLYSGIATVARIIFFISSPVVSVLFASVMIDNKAENSKLFKKAFIIMSILGLIPLIIFSLWPEMMIKILMGQKYIYKSHLLPYMGLALFLASINNALFMYYLALRKKFIAIIAVAGVGLTLIMSFLLPKSFENIILSFTAGSIFILLIFLSKAVTMRYNISKLWKNSSL